MELDCSQVCLVTRQKAVGTKWNTEDHSWTSQTTFLLRGLSPWRSHPERLWSLPLWRFSELDLTQSRATYSSWVCSSRVGWTKWSQEETSSLSCFVIIESSCNLRPKCRLILEKRRNLWAIILKNWMTVLDMLKPIITEIVRGFHKLAKTQYKVLTLGDFYSLLKSVGLLDFYKASAARSFLKWIKSLPVWL